LERQGQFGVTGFVIQPHFDSRSIDEASDRHHGRCRSCGLNRLKQSSSSQLSIRIPSHWLGFFTVEPRTTLLYPFSAQLLVSQDAIVVAKFGPATAADPVVARIKLSVAAIATNGARVFAHVRHSQSASKNSRFVAKLCVLGTPVVPTGYRMWYVTRIAGLSRNTITYSPVASRNLTRLGSFSSGQCLSHSAASSGQAPSQRADAFAKYSSAVATRQSVRCRSKWRRNCLTDPKFATSHYRLGFFFRDSRSFFHSSSRRSNSSSETEKTLVATSSNFFCGARLPVSRGSGNRRRLVT